MKLILGGGGTRDQNFLTNSLINEVIDHTKKILYVPLALDQDEYTYEECLEWITKELNSIDKLGIDMIWNPQDLLNKDLNTYGAIYFSAGNTYKLLKTIKDNNLSQKIYNYLNTDGLIIGQSAGSVIFGKSIDIMNIMDKNKVNLKDTTGLDILSGISIFPHYPSTKKRLSIEENQKRYERHTNAIIEYSLNNEKIIAIPEEDAIYIDNDSYEIIGPKPYYEATKGIMIEKPSKNTQEQLLIKNLTK